MIYKCYECEKLYHENDGAMLSKDSFVFIANIISTCFICKNCMKKETRTQFDKLTSKNIALKESK